MYALINIALLFYTHCAYAISFYHSSWGCVGGRFSGQRGVIVVVDCSPGLACSGVPGGGRDAPLMVAAGDGRSLGSAGGGVGATSDCGGRLGRE